MITGSGRSPGGGHGNPLQYSCLENPRGQRNLAGYSPRGGKELGTTEWLSTYMSIINIRTHKSSVRYSYIGTLQCKVNLTLKDNLCKFIPYRLASQERSWPLISMKSSHCQEPKVLIITKLGPRPLNYVRGGPGASPTMNAVSESCCLLATSNSCNSMLSTLDSWSFQGKEWDNHRHHCLNPAQTRSWQIRARRKILPHHSVTVSLPLGTTKEKLCFPITQLKSTSAG